MSRPLAHTPRTARIVRAIRIACLALAALSLGTVASEAAAHGRVHYGFYFGAPVYASPYWYGGFYRPYPYYYYPYAPTTTVVVPAAPTTYIEQAPVAAVPAQAGTLPAGYWYFCRASNAYYPYVKECPGGWQQVAPQPSAAPAN